MKPLQRCKYTMHTKGPIGSKNITSGKVGKKDRKEDLIQALGFLGSATFFSAITILIIWPENCA